MTAESPNVPDLSGAGVGRVEAYAQAIWNAQPEATRDVCLDEDFAGEARAAIRVADSEQAVLVARVAELEAEAVEEAYTASLRDQLITAYEARAIAAEAMLAKVAALADEHKRTCNPAPYTSERALIERLDGILALASAGRPATSDGEDANGEAPEGCLTHAHIPWNNWCRPASPVVAPSATERCRCPESRQFTCENARCDDPKPCHYTRSVAPSATHSLTEYGTTDCPVQRVRANVDDGECSACGATVAPSATDEDGA